VTEEQIPEEFIPGVVEGIRQVAQQERAEGGRLTHIKVTVVDGGFHPVDSSARAYTEATFLAFEEALTRTPIVPFIETVMKPEDFPT
jgi:elongation factor G